MTLAKYGLSFKDDLALKWRNTITRDRENTPSHWCLFFGSLPQQENFTLTSNSPSHKPTETYSSNSFGYTQKRNRQRNTTFWPGPITYFSSYQSIYVLQNTENHFSWLHCLLLPLQDSLLQCKGQPHRRPEWLQNRAFRITPALETAMPALITDTTHTKQLSLSPNCAHLRH